MWVPAVVLAALIALAAVAPDKKKTVSTAAAATTTDAAVSTATTAKPPVATDAPTTAKTPTTAVAPTTTAAAPTTTAAAATTARPATTVVAGNASPPVARCNSASSGGIANFYVPAGKSCTDVVAVAARLVPTELARPGSPAAELAVFVVCSALQGSDVTTFETAAYGTLADLLVINTCPGDRSKLVRTG